MKRYIDADLFKKEVERLKSLEYPCDNSEQNFGFEYALDRLSDSLGSLQQEQPCDTCTNDKGCVTCKDGELWEGKEQPSEELEKAAEKFVYDWAGLSPTERRIAERAYLAGARWQKEQMLKDAVEGFIFQSADYYPKQLIAGYDGELGMGDKVKIVIIPEKEDKK